MNQFKVNLIVSTKEVDSYDSYWRTQIDDLVKVFWWEKGKMAYIMLEILDGFS